MTGDMIAGERCQRERQRGPEWADLYAGTRRTIGTLVDEPCEQAVGITDAKAASARLATLLECLEGTPGCPRLRREDSRQGQRERPHNEERPDRLAGALVVCRSCGASKPTEERSLLLVASSTIRCPGRQRITQAG